MVTYAQAICALRCFKILHGFKITSDDGSETMQLTVKVMGLLHLTTSLVYPSLSSCFMMDSCGVWCSCLSLAVVQLGSKEAPVLQAVRETEDEAAKTLPEDMSLSDVYEPIQVGSA